MIDRARGWHPARIRHRFYVCAAKRRNDAVHYMSHATATAQWPVLTRCMHPMVDCFDRIAVQMTEIALEPVQLLKQRAVLSSVTLRTPSGGRRYAVTIAKRFPDGERQPPVFRWSIEEIGADGEPLVGGLTAACVGETSYREPEDAYWAAVDGLCEVTKGQ